MPEQPVTEQDIEEQRQQAFFESLFVELKQTWDRFILANHHKEMRQATMVKVVCGFAGAVFATIYHLQLDGRRPPAQSWQDYGNFCLGGILASMDVAMEQLEQTCPVCRPEQREGTEQGGQP